MTIAKGAGAPSSVTTVAEQHTTVLTVSARGSAVGAVTDDQHTIDNQFVLVARPGSTGGASSAVGPGVADHPVSRTGPGLCRAAEQSAARTRTGRARSTSASAVTAAPTLTTGSADTALGIEIPDTTVTAASTVATGSAFAATPTGPSVAALTGLAQQ